MQKRLTILGTLGLVTALALPVAAQDALTAETVVVTVNGTPITLGHLISARASLPAQYDNLPAKELYDGILQQLVQQSAMAQLIDKEDIKEIKLALENEQRSLLAADVIQDAMDRAVTEDDIQAQYQKEFASIEGEEEFNASHILVATQDEADAIKTQLDGGADFATLAKEKSTGPSGPKGGELGWFSAGMMVPPFEAAAIALNEGEISAPVETQFGWHVILLNDKRTQGPPKLDDVRDQITNDLQMIAAQKFIENSTSNADIKMTANLEIDPEILKDTALIED